MMNESQLVSSRRDVIRGAGWMAGAALVLGRPAWAAESQRQTQTLGGRVGQFGQAGQAAQPGQAGTPTPVDDLSREHSVLDRILLVYETSIGINLQQPGGPPRTQRQDQTQPLASAAQLVRTFIEDYHIRLEEDYIFPQFERAGKMTDLVATLRQQHEAGRRLTDAILQAAQSGEAGDNGTLADSIRAYIRMARTHAAHEGTLLYPQIRSIMSEREYRQMGQMFESVERKNLGGRGFESIVAKVASLEEGLRIADLSQFTPRVT